MREDHIIIPAVRVSFPHLFTFPVIDGDEGSCGAVLLLNPDDADDAAMIARIEAQIADTIKTKGQGRKLNADKLCLRVDESRPEREGYQVLSANCRKGKYPVVLGQDGQTILQSESECPIYPGCFVNAKIRIWWQDNKYGKRVNAELIAIQFAGDGDPLDDSYVSHADAVAGFGASSAPGMGGAGHVEDEAGF